MVARLDLDRDAVAEGDRDPGRDVEADRVAAPGDRLLTRARAELLARRVAARVVPADVTGEPGNERRCGVAQGIARAGGERIDVERAAGGARVVEVERSEDLLSADFERETRQR